ncbi:hypothetical protein [Roseateles sp.]|uniref:hypothetical protein n=1 Tax=Roseateles sp. TaxID=1971397 RepID=UPI0039E79CB3
MTYFFWDSPDWFGGALCCRYVVVQFDKLHVPTWIDGAPATAEWHWALGLFTDGQFQVLGAWRDEGPATAQRIAADLHDRGIERIQALAADDALAAAVKGLCPRVCDRTVAELAAPGAASARMRQAIRWTDTAAQHLQERMSRATKKQGPFADHAAAADFIAQAFQRADRDLLADDWDRAKPAPYGLRAAPPVLARTASARAALAQAA